MTTIYKFQDSETAVTAIGATDQFPIYSAAAAGARKVSAALLIGAGAATAATSATTGTNLPAYGISTITSSNNSLGYLLDPPASVGIRKTIVAMSTSVPVVVTTPAVVVVQGSTAIATITFNGSKGVHCELVSLTTAVWLYASTSSTAYAALS